MTAHKKPHDVLKRGIDIVGASIGLVVVAPIMGVVALAVRSKLGSPVVFKQQRPGKDEHIFTLYKFRSMLDINEEQGLVTDDDRMTTFGARLRASSLDELPSLVNVIKGDMSIVGPRPLLVSYLNLYTPYQARRHEVRPGITGLAQVNGRNELDWDERFDLDVEYVDRRSLLLDLKILWKTLLITVQREGITSQGHVTARAFGADRLDDESTTVAEPKTAA